MADLHTTARRIQGRAADLYATLTRPRRPWAGTGAVTSFTRHEILGWIEPEGTAEQKVTLYVNETAVASTWAAPRADDPEPNTSRLFFRFELRGLWRYCRTTDRLTVRVDGRPLMIVGKGLCLKPKADGGKDIHELRRMLARGFVFSHGGKLQLSKTKDVAWQQAVLGMYEQVRVVVSEVLDTDVFLIYGSLLGAVREGGFIGHDRDLDCAFISTATNGAGAARDLVTVGAALIDRGFDVTCRASAIHVNQPGSDLTRIDLFHLFFDADGRLQFPFGVAGTTEFTVADWTGTQQTRLAGRPVLIPAAGEKLAEHIYGASWHRPTPGFNWNRDRTARAVRAGVPAPVRSELSWTNFYRRHEQLGPSSFVDYARTFVDRPGVVIDLGCGDGRDSLAFAGDGHQVVGIDSSAAAVDQATRRVEAAGLRAAVRLYLEDATDATAVLKIVREARDARPDTPVLFYSRFLLHALSAAAEKNLLDLVAEAAHPGDLLAVEFRVGDDQPEPLTTKARFRRPIDPAAFVQRLQQAGRFELVDTQRGTGFSVWKGEDPDLFRCVARRAPDAH